MVIVQMRPTGGPSEGKYFNTCRLRATGPSADEAPALRRASHYYGHYYV